MIKSDGLPIERHQVICLFCPAQNGFSQKGTQKLVTRTSVASYIHCWSTGCQCNPQLSLVIYTSLIELSILLVSFVLVHSRVS